jgi:hypothetical protein
MTPSADLPAPEGYAIHPVTPERWDDLEELFGPQGAFMGCWCAYWRLRHKEFGETSAEEHKCVIRERVESDRPPGLLAYRDGDPVAWVSVEPRERFEAFEYARVYKPIDDTPVWTVTCFYLAEETRGEGLTGPLLEAVKVHVAESGGPAVEGYPEDPEDVDFGSTGTPGYMGLVPTFEAAGFHEVGRLSNGRYVYRADVSG